MEMIDLFTMRENYNRQQIMLCFNGPISVSYTHLRAHET